MRAKHAYSAHCLRSGIFNDLDSFPALESRLSALASNKERGDAFEVFAEAYLATQKIALASEVWPFEAIPQIKRQQLSLDTGRDMGVDGIYETTDGELRAYQVKFRSRRPALTWDELSTFMGLTDQVGQRVLFTNCDTLPSLMQDRSGFVAIRGSDLDRLTAEDFGAIREWLHCGHIERQHKQPRPHQDEALVSIAAGLENNNRATVVMACGTGKSLVALWAAERQASKTLLVLVPSLALVRQLLHEWLRETSWEQFSFMCVCSDPTVVKGADDLVVHQADLDFPVTTDSAIVRQYLDKPFSGTRIVFSTYQSAQVVAEGMPLDASGQRIPFDLGIFDEAHKTASRDGTRFSFALEDSNLPIRQRLFFTATPRHYDVRKKDKEGDSTLVYSMDRPEVYGPVVHTLSFAEAARRGIICDYKVVISVVTSAMVDDHLLQKGEVIVGGDAVKARQVALQIALQKAVEKYGVSRIFTFHGSVKAARSFTSADSEGISQHLPDFNTLHVSGEMPTSRREDQMKAFRQADKAVMSNARCLTEGVDVPAVDMVAFISPRKSKVDIVQATGRAMRRSPGKEFGYVMVPLFVEQAANESIEEALKRTGYDDVWDLLGAMREQDEVLVDIIRQMQEDKGRTGGYNESRFSERVDVLGPSVSLETIRESITAECLDSLGESWDKRFGELLSFKEKHGDLNIPINWSNGLGMWTSVQRRSNKNKLLSSERIKRLNSIEFLWNKLDAQWQDRLYELIAYKEQFGNLNVPQKHDGGLGSWVSQQKQYESKGLLDSERRKALEDIGFSFANRKPKTDWDQRYNELLDYVRVHGTTDVPRNYPSGLGVWVGNQKSFIRNNKLTDDRLAKMQSIGFRSESLDSRWETRFMELIEYKAKYGSINVCFDSPTGLGQWISNQKMFCKTGKMPEDRKLRLESIGVSLSSEIVKKSWDDKLQQLINYKSEYGNVDVPQNHHTGLGKWISKQIVSHNAGQLSSERFAILSDIGVIFNKRDERWNNRFIELLKYKAEHGTTDVPKSYPGGLGAWVYTQKATGKTGNISGERRTRLDEIGFGWDSK